MLRPKLGLGLGASEGRDLRAVREGSWRDWLRESLGERGQEKEAAKEGSGRQELGQEAFGVRHGKCGVLQGGMVDAGMGLGHFGRPAGSCWLTVAAGVWRPECDAGDLYKATSSAPHPGAPVWGV